MGPEFFVVAWLFGMVFPDGRVTRYHDTFPDRFKTEVECLAFAKTLPVRFPRENQIDQQGLEVRYADFHCLAIKPTAATAWASESKPPVNPPLPPRRPAGL
jgi:hypothetical protein